MMIYELGDLVECQSGDHAGKTAVIVAISYMAEPRRYDLRIGQQIEPNVRGDKLRLVEKAEA